MKQRMGERDGTGANRTAITSLTVLVKAWPTPRASANENRTTRPAPSHGHGHGHTLAGSAAGWPTPNTRDAASSARGTTTTGVMHPGVSLTDAIRQFPTPAARDYRTANLKTYEERGGGSKGEQLQNFVSHHFRQDQMTERDGHGSSSDGQDSRRPSPRLNPDFVDWLMGLPPGWTDATRPLFGLTAYGAQEMESYLSSQREHSLNLHGDCGVDLEG